MKCSLGLRYRFKSVHTVPEEVDAFGDPLVHGHNYELVLKLQATDSKSDWVISRDKANRIVDEKVLHFAKNRNLDNWISPATGEEICNKIYKELKTTDLGPLLTEISLVETLKNTFKLKVLD